MDRTVGDWHTCSALKVVGIYDVLQCSRTHFTSHQQTHKKPVRTRHCLSVNGPFQTWRLGPAHGAACGPTTTHIESYLWASFCKSFYRNAHLLVSKMIDNTDTTPQKTDRRPDKLVVLEHTWCHHVNNWHHSGASIRQEDNRWCWKLDDFKVYLKYYPYLVQTISEVNEKLTSNRHAQQAWSRKSSF